MIANPPPVPISQRCCEGAKKKPSHKYERGRDFDCKCLGLRRDEGGARSTRYKNCYEYDPSETTQSMRPIWWFTAADKEAYVDLYDVVFSDCYTVYGMKRTGCAGCPYNSAFEDELQTLQEHEPKLYKATISIFGAIYEYTRKYREFKANARRAEKERGQQNLFDYIEGGGDK